MAFPVLIGSGSIGATSSPVNIPIPTHTAGDLLIVFGVNDTPSTTFMGLTPGPQWQSLASGIWGGNVIKMAMWAKLATGVNDSGVLSGAAQDIVGGCVVINGHGVTGIGDILVSVVASGLNAGPDSPSLNAGATREWMWLAVAGSDDDDDNTPFGPANYNEVLQTQSANSTSSCLLQLSYRNITTGTENPGSGLLAADEEWLAYTLAIPGYTGTYPFSMSLGQINLDAKLRSLTNYQSSLSPILTVNQPIYLTGFPMLPVFDTFNRPDEVPISGIWAGPIYPLQSGLSLINNQIVCPISGGSSYTTTKFGSDMEFYCKNASGTGVLGFNLYWKISTVPTGVGWSAYNLSYDGTFNQFTINRINQAGIIGDDLIAGPFDQLFSTGDSIGIRHINSGIEIKLQSGTGPWTTLASINHTSFRNPGYVGISMFSAGMAFDSIGGGNLPRGETFSVQTLGSILAEESLDAEFRTNMVNNNDNSLETLAKYQSPLSVGSFPYYTFLEDFNRANEIPLSGNWIPNLFFNKFLLSGNKAFSTGIGSSASESFYNQKFGPDVDVFMTNAGTSGNTHGKILYWGIAAIPTGFDDAVGYKADHENTSDEFNIWKLNGPSNTLLTGAIKPLNSGDSYGIRHIANQITLYFKSGENDWISLVSYTGSNAYSTSGYIGISVWKSGDAIDNVGVGTLPRGDTCSIDHLLVYQKVPIPAFPALGKLDDFNRPDETPISSGWLGPIYSAEQRINLQNNVARHATANDASAYSIEKIGPNIDLAMTCVSGTVFKSLYWGLSSDPTGTGWSGYELDIDHTTNEIDLFRINSAYGGITLLMSNLSRVIASGDGIGIRHLGSGITIYHRSGVAGDWFPISAVADSTYNRLGHYGIYVGGSSDAIDNVIGGTLPIGDVFNIEHLLSAVAGNSGVVMSGEFPIDYLKIAGRSRITRFVPATTYE